MNLKELIKRIDIDNVEKYVKKCSSNTTNDNNDKYEAQIKRIINKTSEYIDKILTDKSEANELWMYISALTRTYKEIYFEMGLCAGVRLGHEIHNDKDI